MPYLKKKFKTIQLLLNNCTYLSHNLSKYFYIKTNFHNPLRGRKKHLPIENWSVCGADFNFAKKNIGFVLLGSIKRKKSPNPQ